MYMPGAKASWLPVIGKTVKGMLKQHNPCGGMFNSQLQQRRKGVHFPLIWSSAGVMQPVEKCMSL